ncbi:MAG TPA: hypothetical protein VMN79_04760 [Casimicrobiaceae bacterium]|nr:hypothetical protein [Casimicrobiaceae bacterium]
MFYRLRDRIHRWRFARACRGVLRTPPVRLDQASGMVVLSQLPHKDVLLFLLALKSFARRVPPRTVYVLDDGSLTPDDRSVLRDHVPGLTFFERADFRSAACPVGGCWERLLSIGELVRDDYVIQLDSDTLTLGAIDEVGRAVADGFAFILGTWDRQGFESMQERAATARKLSKSPRDHVQLVSEAHLDQLSGFESRRYVRGCAGFAGYPRRSFERSFVEATSAEMRRLMGDKWSEWGSEQVMANIVVASVERARVLPHPKYADCHKMRVDLTEFIHFIGSCRFDRDRYARLGEQVIATL